MRIRAAETQDCPVVPNAARAVSPAAWSRSASAKTRRGHLPPSSRATDAPRAPQTLAIWRPVAVEPVKVTLSTRSSATSARPVSAPPVTTLRTPGGRPASEASTA